MKQAMISRYEQAAQFVSGEVADMACGWGLGTHILTQAEDVQGVEGFDADAECVEYANKMFKEVGCSASASVADFDTQFIAYNYDWIVTLETIEHLKYPLEFVQMIQESCTKGIVLSVPLGQTTHKNEFHLHDFESEEVNRWFPRWEILYDGILTQKVGKKYIRLGKLAVYLKP